MCRKLNFRVFFIVASVIWLAWSSVGRPAPASPDASRGGGAEAPKPITLDTDPNLAGWWKFDETAGKTAADSSKFKHKGTLKGELSFDKSSVEGKIGKALKFGGKNDVVEIKDYKGITGTKPRTVTAWIKTNKTAIDIE